MKRRNISCQRFGRLLAIEDVGKRGLDGRLWRFMCDCGGETIVPLKQVTRGITESCGCLQKEAAARSCVARSTHGLNKARINNIWRGMIARCYRDGSVSFHAYGARGIRVCREWKDSMTTFATWAFSNGYDDEKSIDRIDVNGDYSPENCRWATAQEQCENKRTNHFVTIRGETKTLAAWARQIGIRPAGLAYRIRNNWPDDELISLKDHHRKRGSRA